MEKEYPEFIYKYRPIERFDDLNDDYYLDALLNHYAIFSSRKNFNDLFDSKIELIKPTVKEIKELSQSLPKLNRLQLLSHIDKGKFTPEGEIFLEQVINGINKTIDSYAFISLSSVSNSNLMWSHYGNSHKGFCIEFKTEHVAARKVKYAHDIPSLNLIDVYKTYYDIPTDLNIGNVTLDALHSKLLEWEYESEYRFLADKSLGRITSGQNFIKVDYDPDFVESVIFGCRMDSSIKEYIIANMPTGTKFKQSIVGRNSMRVVPYND
ncbi:DUF2971 domain-containing protein [Kluyvera cryocrescens]|uniref:DUF2971 domain-containing protein n=1 Tax=Kluyvera cryocrescens TaxID=580 RepID=UPI002DBB9221|nr:DUF2971 domain-containing protein [Kluyvera cryocrescens]MEB7712354.1 DUF2971 domain-containing protein [Kluyvera cryocrescens]